MKRRIAARPPERDVPARRRLAVRPELDELEAIVCAAYGVERNALGIARRHGNDARAAAVYLARECAALPVTQLAQRFGSVSASAISKLLRQVVRRRQRDRRWDRRLNHIEHKLRLV